jgi:hypothetical protein
MYAINLSVGGTHYYSNQRIAINDTKERFITSLIDGVMHE